MALIYASAGRIAAHEVRSEVHREADRIAALAEATLAAHRDTGASSVHVEHGKLDAFVVLEDDSRSPGALSIEYATEDSPGLRILRGAAGLD